MSQISKGSQLPTKRRFIEIMQDINFGRITNLSVRSGEPEFTPETVIEREIRLGGQNGPRPERQCDDFALKQEVVALFDQLTRIGDGTIRELSIKAGLPFLMRIEQRAA